jgi:hypoxanthine-DNA glycosylase
MSGPVRKQAFAPVVDANTRLLILGSLPGDASLKAGQYYAHPRNAFWRLIGGVIGQPLLHRMDYEDRLALLRRSGVGLWDVIVEAERIGSLDTAIRSPEYADLKTLVAALPNLRAVAFNGGKAAKAGAACLGAGDGGIARIALPSSSPAHARPLAEKAAAWDVLEAFIARPDMSR